MSSSGRSETSRQREGTDRSNFNSGHIWRPAARPLSAKTCREQMQQRAPLVDHLAGEDQDQIRDRQPDRLRGSEIEDHVELRGLFHG
jgi:hypothetical protein